MTADELAAAPHFVYRLLAVDGALLYIGCSVGVEARVASHHSDQPWSDLIDRHEVDGPYSRDEALRREAAAIKAEAPRFNVAHNLTPDRYRQPSERAFLFVQQRVCLSGRSVGRAFFNGDIPLDPTDDDVRRWVRTLDARNHRYPCRWDSCWCHHSSVPVEQIESGLGWPGSDLCPDVALVGAA